MCIPYWKQYLIFLNREQLYANKPLKFLLKYLLDTVYYSVSCSYPTQLTVFSVSVQPCCRRVGLTRCCQYLKINSVAFFQIANIARFMTKRKFLANFVALLRHCLVSGFSNGTSRQWL